MTSRAASTSPPMKALHEPPVSVGSPSFAEFRHAGPWDGDSVGQSTVVKWISPDAHRHGDPAVGIEYDGNRLVVLGVKRTGRRQTISGFLAADFEGQLTKAELGGLLREFDPMPGVRVQVAVAANRAAVRRFPLPLLPKRRRLPAAIWEGQKLIPFPLKADEALYGFSFTPGPARNLVATLVLAAIEDAGWILEGVTISGAHRPTGLGSASTVTGADQVTATVLWTQRRAAFMVFRSGQLQFHYDLGVPANLSFPSSSGPNADSTVAAGWVKDMSRAISDALEFYLGAFPQFAPERLELLGVPTAVAPLVTDWQDRFGLPVVVIDVLARISDELPGGVGEWIRANPGLLTTAALAATGCPVIDLTPPALAVVRARRVFNGVARGACILSAVAILAWTGLLWMRLNLSTHAMADADQELQSLRASSPANEMERVSGVFSDIQAVSSEVTMRPQPWMSWARSVTSTIPTGADLALLSLELPESALPGGSLPIAHLEGRLDPSERPTSLIFADWIGRLDRFAGSGASRLVSTRAIDWKGGRSSAFVLEVLPPGAAPGGVR
jgi:hypothetical protein